MPVLRLTVAYDGTAFSGFQRQPAVRTVAGVLEDTLSKVLGERVAVTGAGRTDAGVHATGQVISLPIARLRVPLERLPLAVNALLPADVKVREAAEVAGDFSARFSARSRAYVYAVRTAALPDPLSARHAAHVPYPVDDGRVREACAHLVGEHDFRSFCGVLPENGITVRRIEEIAVERRGVLLRIEIRADGFLHRMVRTIVGTVLECGWGRRDPQSIPAVLAARSRAAAGRTAPPQGLYLAGVRYPDGYDSFAEPPIFGPVPMPEAPAR